MTRRSGPALQPARFDGSFKGARNRLFRAAGGRPRREGDRQR